MILNLSIVDMGQALPVTAQRRKAMIALFRSWGLTPAEIVVFPFWS